MKKPRGSVQKAQSKFLGAYVPDPVVEALDRAVQQSDTDRSKFIRAAIKEKLARLGTAAAA